MGGPVDAATARRLDLGLASAQADGRLPSVVAAVLRDGEIVWSGRRGSSVAGFGQETPTPLDTQYRIGSITKTVTAVLVLQLVRDGRVDLDAPVADVLGDIGYADRSVRTLLAHRGGLQSEPAGSWWERSPGMPWEELVAGNDGSGEVLPALQQFHYSNLGYALLGQLVARVSGASWWECARDRVLTPLGMTRTTFDPEAPAAQGYSVHPYAATLHREPAADTAAMAPAGQLWSTAADLAAYARFLLRGHPDVLDEGALLRAAHPQSGDREDALSYAHGLGFQLITGGAGMLVGHSGSMPGFLAGCYVDRHRGTGAAVLANGTWGVTTADLCRDLLETLEACEPAPPPEWRPAAAVPDVLAELLGLWHWGNTPFVFAYEDGEVVARRAGAERFRIAERDGQPVGVSGYHHGERVHLARHPDGTVSHLDIATFVFTRTPYDPDVAVPGGHPD